jgi:hypothetical protein
MRGCLVYTVYNHSYSHGAGAGNMMNICVFCTLFLITVMVFVVLGEKYHIMD